MDLSRLVWQLIVAIVLVIPGLNATWVIERLAGPLSVRPAERLYRAVALSVMILLPASPWLASLVRRLADGGVHHWEAMLAGAVLLFIAPVGLGWVAARVRYHGGLRRYLTRQTNIDPAPTAWDYAFRDARPRFVRVRLNDGSMVGGRFGRDSFASSYPQDHGLFIQEVWRLSAEGTFLNPIAGTDGVLISPGTIALVELFRAVEVHDG